MVRCIRSGVSSVPSSVLRTSYLLLVIAVSESELSGWVDALFRFCCKFALRLRRALILFFDGNFIERGQRFVNWYPSFCGCPR
jgi:hypothetical protein